MDIVFDETGYPPLSLRDISPTGGEIVPCQNLTPARITTYAAADAVSVWGRKAPPVSNLSPCGGDVAKATEGGIALSTSTEAPAP